MSEEVNDIPQTIPFHRGRSIVLTHYEFSDHQEVTVQWLEKTPEDGGILWLGKGATLHEACNDAINEMFKERT